MNVVRLVTAVAVLVLAPFAAPAVAAESLAERRAPLDEAFRSRLAALAAKCDDLGLEEQARITRGWFIPRDPSRLYVFLPAKEDAATPPPVAPQLVRFWHEAWMKLRRSQAAALFDLAKESLDRGEARGAFLLIHETLHEDPEHAEARRILGSPAAEKPQTKPVRTPHPKFGWPAGRHWRAVTDHYEIKTDHSPEEGARLASRLEELHAAWRQVFAEYWLGERDLRLAMEGGSLPSGSRRKFQAVLFRDRDEYVRQLQRSEPQIAVSEGYYAPGDRTAYFFVSEEDVSSTWRHEGTHQLLYELGNATPQVGMGENFWAVEAPALYMESLTPHEGYCTVGGFDAERLQYARFRALSEDYYMPLEELTRLGREELQRHSEIRRLYSQAAGLAHFFLDGDGGRYRPAFLHYLAAVHQGRDRAETLAALADTPYAELDKQYRDFLDVTDEDLADSRPPARIAMLSLGGASITDAGLAHLARYPNLTWLNLAGTRITDAGLQHVAQCKDLETLYLTGTQVTDAGLDALEGLTGLKMLDLEGTPTTEAARRRILQRLSE
ncbi:MAG: hypothetical protein KY475_23045 [Planctomycetes bacterium]|nr:hypothetical protein [Planctomycetota bacterium]